MAESWDQIILLARIAKKAVGVALPAFVCEFS